MRILIDALCAEFGGIRTYVEQLLGRWAATYPADDVHVVLRAGSTIATPGLTRHELAVRGPDVVGRPWAQATKMHRLEHHLRPDVVLATAPTTDVRRTQAPLAVTILDLRAEILPGEFSRGRRLLRAASYGRTYHLAEGFLSISQRSLDDLHRLHPATRTKHGAAVLLGADHVLDWPDPTRSGPAIGFAHHSNKNPQLLIDAWALARQRGVVVPALTLLGVPAALRDELSEQIAERGLQGSVELAGFLPDEEFQAVLAAAELIAFPSSFEGFGLPIVEGMHLGKPVVIGPDPGCLEVAGGHGWVATDWTAPALADAIAGAAGATSAHIDAARAWAAHFTWDRTVRQTRAALETIALEGRTT